MSNILCEPPSIGRISVYFTYNQTKLENLDGVRHPTLCVGIIVHPRNICKKHCSSQYYSMKILFIATLSFKIPTLFRIFLLFVLALLMIYNGVSYFPWRQDSGGWCRMLNIEWNTTMQLNNVLLSTTWNAIAPTELVSLYIFKLGVMKKNLG